MPDDTVSSPSRLLVALSSKIGYECDVPDHPNFPPITDPGSLTCRTYQPGSLISVPRDTHYKRPIDLITSLTIAISHLVVVKDIAI